MGMPSTSLYVGWAIKEKVFSCTEGPNSNNARPNELCLTDFARFIAKNILFSSSATFYTNL